MEMHAMEYGSGIRNGTHTIVLNTTDLKHSRRSNTHLSVHMRMCMPSYAYAFVSIRNTDHRS